MKSSSEHLLRVSRARPLLGTLVEIQAGACQGDILNAAISRAFELIEQVHQSMSCQSMDSTLNRLNQALPGHWIELDRHCLRVLRAAEQVRRRTGGLFDPRLPAGSSEPASPLLLEQRGLRVRKSSPEPICLDGIAKGYAVDLAVAELKRWGVRQACVNAGGDLRVFGAAEVPVLVPDPRAPERAAALVRLCDQAMATSASCDGQVGMMRHPAPTIWEGNWSVTVAAPSAMLADALTKVVVGSGVEQSRSLLAGFRAEAWALELRHAA